MHFSRLLSVRCVVRYSEGIFWYALLYSGPFNFLHSIPSSKIGRHQPETTYAFDPGIRKSKLRVEYYSVVRDGRSCSILTPVVSVSERLVTAVWVGRAVCYLWVWYVA